MLVAPVHALSISHSAVRSSTSPEEAAREFEAMLIAQLMKSAREAGNFDDSDSSLAGSESYIEFAEKYLAGAMAETGVFGFAPMILGALEAPAGQTAEGDPGADKHARGSSET